MSDSSVFPRVRALVADSLAIPESDVRMESRLITDLGADSLDFVDLMFAIPGQTMDIWRATLDEARAHDAEVILVDNASADGSVDLVRERFPEVRLVQNETNEGFAGGCNAGVRAARSPAAYTARSPGASRGNSPPRPPTRTPPRPRRAPLISSR